jgi:Baseplate J-like protein
VYQVDDTPETIHLYVVREKEKQPFVVLPILAALLCIGALIAVTYYSALHPVYAHKTLTVPTIALPPQVFRATTNIMPTGVHTYPATDAHGVLTFTNGSIIGQSIPAGFTVDGVVTYRAVYVPAGSADGYGKASVSAHAGNPGKNGNMPALAINEVIGSSLYIRNLTPFIGGRDSYSVKFITPEDRALALTQAREHLTSVVSGLHYPCSERISGALTVTWRCQFVTYHVPSYMQVLRVRLSGKNLLVDVAYTPPPVRVWAK